MTKLCTSCAQEYEAADRELELLEIKEPGRAVMLKKAAGCFKCNNTGYKGRTAIHEILAADSEILRLIAGRAPTEEIKKYAVSVLGMTMLKQAAARLVLERVTTFEEYIRVTAGM
jgi:type IV pilus assembly protein PilB